MVVSLEPNASVLLFGAKVIELTKLLWPLSVCRHFLIARSQSLTVLLLEPNASVMLFSAKAIDLT